MARRANASAWTARRGRRPQHVRKLLAREPGDLASGQDQYTGPHRESDELKPMMYGDEKKRRRLGWGRGARGEGEQAGLASQEIFTFLVSPHFCGGARRGGFLLF